ncbi:MAG TPA: Mur ligase family protein [Candidatus Saccharimonadales bacterium]|nr:Mur ligase family protein [Candidatus Saccharimonadales bacterium]
MKQLKTALRHLVARQLERRVQRLIETRRLKVVAITGSVGKTSTKLAVATVLGQKYRVQVQRGNFNSEIGLPLAIFELDVPAALSNPLAWLRIMSQIDKKLAGDYPYDVLVLELGVDEPGDMARYLRYLTPDIGIVTAIAAAHLEQLGSLTAIAREKMALARASRAVLLNAEDKRVMTEAGSLGKPIQTYGVAAGEVHWEHVRRAKDLTLAGSLILNDGEITVQTTAIGKHNLAPLAAAAAVGEELGLTSTEIAAGVEAITPFAGRMQVLAGADGSTIIDDTYNAAPTAVLAALQTLTELPGRHIAILGSMNELGAQSEHEHREVGAAAAKKVDLLVTVGTEAGSYIAAGAAAAGLPAEQIHAFRSPYKAGEYVRSKLGAGDIVLAKGSQNGVFAEEAVALLLANPADKAKLVRQNPAWQQRKRAQFS